MVDYLPSGINLPQLKLTSAGCWLVLISLPDGTWQEILDLHYTALTGLMKRGSNSSSIQIRINQLINSFISTYQYWLVHLQRKLPNMHESWNRVSSLFSLAGVSCDKGWVGLHLAVTEKTAAADMNFKMVWLNSASNCSPIYGKC